MPRAAASHVGILFLAGGHDSPQRRIARLVDFIADGNQGGQSHFHDVIAALDEAFDHHPAVGHLDLLGDRHTGNLQEFRHTYSDLPDVPVSRLASAEDQIKGADLLDGLGQDIGGGVCVGVLKGRVLQQNPFVGAHGHGLFHGALSEIGSQTDDGHLAAVLFAELQCRLDSVLIEQTDTRVDVGGRDDLVPLRINLERIGGGLPVRHLLDADDQV